MAKNEIEKNILVIPFEIIIGSQNVLERIAKSLLYFAITVTFFYLCLMHFVENAHKSFGGYKYTYDGNIAYDLNSGKNSDSLVGSLDTKEPPNSKSNFNPTNELKEDNPKVLIDVIENDKGNSDIKKSGRFPNLNFQNNDWVDEKAPVHYPWPNQTQCKDFGIRFAKNGTFEPRALASFPGSGNSWLRYLIECSTGIFTGSVYNANIIFDKGLYGEYRKPHDGTTILQKTHYNTIFPKGDRHLKTEVVKTKTLFGYRGILVIRNPFKSIFSYWNFLKTNDQMKHIQRLNSSHPDWIYHVEYSSEKWESIIRSFVENSDNLLIVKYEELKSNPLREITKILRYLDLPIDQKRLDCLMMESNLEGPFHREKKTKDTQVIVDSPQSTKNVSLPFIYESIYPPPLSGIVYTKIRDANTLFAKYKIPIVLNYTVS